MSLTVSRPPQPRAGPAHTRHERVTARALRAQSSALGSIAGGGSGWPRGARERARPFWAGWTGKPLAAAHPATLRLSEAGLRQSDTDRHSSAAPTRAAGGHANGET